MRECANPGCDNPVRRPERDYCSPGCFQAHRRDTTWADLPRSKKCAECGMIFEPRVGEPPSLWMRRKTCGGDCISIIRGRNGVMNGPKNNTYWMTYRVPAAELEANRIRAEAEYARCEMDKENYATWTPAELAHVYGAMR